MLIENNSYREDKPSSKDKKINKYRLSPSKPVLKKSQSEFVKSNKPNEDLTKELEDPGNALIREEIEKIINLQREVGLLNTDYKEIQQSKSEDKDLIQVSKEKDDEINKQKFNYVCKLNIFNISRFTAFTRII